MLGNFGERESSLSPDGQGGGAARQETAKKKVIKLKWLLTEVKERGRHENVKLWPQQVGPSGKQPREWKRF